MNRPIVIGVLLFLFTLGGLVYFLKRQPSENSAGQSSKPAALQTPAKPAEPAIERRINVRLFFISDQSSRLTPENRYVAYRETLRDQAFEVLQELVKGPKTEMGASLPEGTQLWNLFITKDGIAYVDFSPELASKHTGGSLAEISTVYSIVDTLTLNFPQIKKVQILVNDQAVESLTGHIDLSRPLTQDLSVVEMGEAQTQVSSLVIGH